MSKSHTNLSVLVDNKSAFTISAAPATCYSDESAGMDIAAFILDDEERSLTSTAAPPVTPPRATNPLVSSPVSQVKKTVLGWIMVNVEENYFAPQAETSYQAQADSVIDDSYFSKTPTLHRVPTTDNVTICTSPKTPPLSRCVSPEDGPSASTREQSSSQLYTKVVIYQSPHVPVTAIRDISLNKPPRHPAKTPSTTILPRLLDYEAKRLGSINEEQEYDEDDIFSDKEPGVMYYHADSFISPPDPENRTPAAKTIEHKSELNNISTATEAPSLTEQSGVIIDEVDCFIVDQLINDLFDLEISDDEQESINKAPLLPSSDASLPSLVMVAGEETDYTISYRWHL